MGDLEIAKPPRYRSILGGALNIAVVTHRHFWTGSDFYFVTCSHHFMEVGASCSRLLLQPVSTGYPRMSYGCSNDCYICTLYILHREGWQLGYRICQFLSATSYMQLSMCNLQIYNNRFHLECPAKSEHLFMFLQYIYGLGSGVGIQRCAIHLPPTLSLV